MFFFCCVAAVDLLSLSFHPPPFSLSLTSSHSSLTTAGNNNKEKGSNEPNKSTTEPFADDVRRLRDLRRAERAAAASAPFHTRLAALFRRLWLQYLITWAAYCFDWWERLVVHGCLLTVAGLLVYGVSLGVRGARAVMAVSGAALSGGGSSRGGFASSFWPQRR